ncbi:hypothetical protein Kosp01_24140 [Kocuria sp. NBRC 114282]|uniref:hypothetical protein n=1 Tax=Kocuria sp. NBRC 114282 TaxID=2994520 RepID=UPI0024A52EB6|nr:hypothetical protein [Kocuria sp. NBRC 114282]GLU87668.1 hypothetical protein Kosp01_24140 [Kocuria sp. NBRC 114282]
MRAPRPEVDADITGQELDRDAQFQVRALEADNAEAVSQHLVMVARYIEDDPAFALEHARYAVSRAGRVAAVREAAGVAAYENGEYHEALKELRTYRRMTGDDIHLPLMVDCERALGRPEKALELAASEGVTELPADARVELAIIVAGLRRDEGDADGALKALEIPQLDRNRGFSYSPRLFRAYGEALRGVGREKEATAWDRQALVAEAALGTGPFEDPEIVDLGEDEIGVELDSAEGAQRDIDRVSDVTGQSEAEAEADDAAQGSEEPAAQHQPGLDDEDLASMGGESASADGFDDDEDPAPSSGPSGIVRDAAADDESLADGAASEGETEQEDS